MTRSRTFARLLLCVAGGLGLASYAKHGDTPTMAFATLALAAGLTVMVRSHWRR